MYLAVRSAPILDETTPPLVDIALVYGNGAEGAAFDMGSGFKTVALPDAVSAVLSHTVRGSGGVWVRWRPVPPLKY